MNELTQTTETFDPRSGYVHTPERQAIINFEVAAWEFRKAQHVKALTIKHITDYEAAREALQDFGKCEDAIDAIECQHVRIQAVRWNLVIEGMYSGKLPPVMEWGATL